ncbi:hypothetical protein GOP47_0008167 [Adiantum capillus-veneris]|uniref:Uncharacterized protein n=1 Tax=Adiantum capillus-veneris TaxID=13818 RepID=A0A9D4ZJF1_ADICA|nr:hypothetical protein GOP47_0008167 [Adiantum capillus-veneris]
MGIKAFVEGGLASVVAGGSTHPLDLIKVRMQLQGEAPQVQGSHRRPAMALALRPGSTELRRFYSAAVATHVAATQRGPMAVGAEIVRTEGVKALFSGVSATVLRQCLYSTTRMGLYEVLKQRWAWKDGKLPVVKKVGAGLIAGAIGAAIGNPADVAMVRMQADGRLPRVQRRNYAGVGDALWRMMKQEGVRVLWRGSALTMQRAMVVTASQLATYDQAKESLARRRLLPPGIATHVVASCAAGLVASLASNPIDVIKTRFMNMTPGTYTGGLDCALKTIRSEGPLALYKGFLPTVMRQGPFTIVLFVSLEQIRHLLRHL